MSTYSTKKYFEKKFEKILLGLNNAQLEAVKTLEGPVLTIAGPGTGKTHILAARIGQILQETDSAPNNILCLTFTDAAVTAMRKRLLEFIGPDANKIHIYTFHSFCNKVIQENLDIFGFDELLPASDLEIIEIIREMIDSLSPLHPLRIRNRRKPYRFEARLRNIFSRMKSEGWEADYVSGMIDNHLAALPFDENYIYKRKSGNFNKGDLKQKEIDRETQRMEELRSAVLLFDDFDQRMKNACRYDFDDMILWVLRIFKDQEQEDILRNYQEQYQYILVDEFQDTNGAQSSILMKLIEYWDEPNVFVVGDDDQSIYEFQGARVKNMIDFFEKYRQNGMQLIVLEENYRSGQPILDAAKHLIEQNNLRIIRYLDILNIGNVIKKNLTAANQKILKSDIEVSIKEYPNRIQEEIDIINSIKSLHDKGIPYNEMAIIYYMHKQSADLIKLLETNEIPYRTKRQTNILNTPLIRNLLKLLQYLQSEFENPYSGEELVYELLHFNFWKVNASDIAKITSYLARTNRQKHDLGNYDYLRWRDLIRDLDLLEEIGLSGPQNIFFISELTDELIPLIVNNPLPDFLEKLLNKSGLITHILNSEEKSWNVELTSTFFNFVRNELNRNPNLNLKGLLSIIERMEDNRLEISIVRASHAEDGVNLLTAHSAKGLEFEAVFMLHCLADYWEPSGSKIGGSQFSLPENLRKSNEETDHKEAARRLFYVAMTRAKTFLQMSYHVIGAKQKEVKRSEFLDSLVTDFGMLVQECAVPAERIIEEQFLSLLEPSLPESANIDKAEIDSILENFRLSVSALNSYLDCPRSFYYQNILSIPSTNSVEALYGDAVHNALKKMFDWAHKEKAELLPPLETFLAYFNAEMNKRSIQFSPKAYDDALILAMDQLPKYYESRIDQFNEQLKYGVWTERPFRNAAFKNVPLKGIIDKVCFEKDANEDDILHVVDYKTGKLDDKRFYSISSRNAKGGSYYRQLVFYKILIENSGTTDLKVQSAEIDYLSPDDSGIFPSKKMFISETDTEAVGNLIEETYAKIMSQQFSEGCEKPYCKWCNFVKSQVSPDSFRDEEAEMLDD